MLNEIPGVEVPGAASARSTPTRASRACSARNSRASGLRRRPSLRSLILEEAEVAVVPGEAFGTNGYFRLSYAMSDADLEEGVGRIGKLLSEAK